MTYTPEQISQIDLKVLKEIEEPDIMNLSLQEKRDLAKSTSSVDILRSLSTYRNTLILQEVAQNPSTPEDVLRTLATDENHHARRGVAQNPNTPEDILRNLETDDDFWVRYWVANNSNTPEDAIRTLAKEELRKQLAKEIEEDAIRYHFNPNYKPGPYKTLELTKVQYDALKQLIDYCKNSDLLNIHF